MHVFRAINKREASILFLGDVAFLYVSLWLMLLVRDLSIPAQELFMDHLAPFSILFAVWLVVFFIAGLYEKQTLVLKSRLPSTILRVQIANSVIAVLFFYLIPYFGITPKTNLFIYLVISFALILFWRLRVSKIFGARKRQNAILIGSGEEMHELFNEVNNNDRYDLAFISSVDLDEVEELDFQSEIIDRVYSEEISIVVIDIRNEKVTPILPKLYNLIYSKVRFIDMHKVYEDIFDRVPLSLVKYSWFLENISATSKFTYDFLKRSMDIAVSLVVGILSLVIYPLIMLAIALDDGRPFFFKQERVGKRNKRIYVTKFRSMDEEGVRVTKVGKFLRKTRLDELPQLWDVLRGNLSLIGPRPEKPEYVKHYEGEVPYYNIRHVITPGLSGWAQLYHENHPHHAPDVSETKVKLSYDLYYIKNRSMLLDFKIALKTIKTLVSSSGA